MRRASSAQTLARGPEDLPGTGACVGLSEPPPGLLHGWSRGLRERERERCQSRSAALGCAAEESHPGGGTGEMAHGPHAACSFKN